MGSHDERDQVVAFHNKIDRLIDVPDATDQEWAEAALAGCRVVREKRNDGYDDARYPYRSWLPDGKMIGVFFAEREAWLACWLTLNGRRTGITEWELTNEQQVRFDAQMRRSERQY